MATTKHCILPIGHALNCLFALTADTPWRCNRTPICSACAAENNSHAQHATIGLLCDFHRQAAIAEVAEGQAWAEIRDPFLR